MPKEFSHRLVCRPPASQHATALLFFLTLCRLIKMLGLAWCLLPCDLLDIPHTNTRAHLSSSFLRLSFPLAHSQPLLLFSVTEYLTHTMLPHPFFHSAPNPRAAYIVWRESKFPDRRRLNKSLPLQEMPKPQC